MIRMPLPKKPYRFDLVIVNWSDKNGKFSIEMIPNPERYERRTVNGEEGYYDLFDNLFIHDSVLEKGIPTLNGTPIYYSPKKIRKIDEYIHKRIPHIREYLANDSNSYEQADLSEEFLNVVNRDEMTFVILCIDLRGSTRMSQELPPPLNAKIISLFLREMALLVDGFNAYVLKYVGDGLIAYFPEPNLLGKTDNAVDCSASMRKMIRFGINPILKEHNMPELHFRMGLDSGRAVITNIGAPAIKMQKDLIGETINLTAKIQSVADTDEILIGESTTLNLHTFWRKKIEKKEKKNWNFKNITNGRIYPLYSLLENW